jgi:hypothetical protein
MKKLNIHDVVGLVRYAIQRGLVHIELHGDFGNMQGRSPAPWVAES